MDMKEFFLVALPGLEDLVLKELKDWFPDLEATQEYGGVTAHAPMEVGLSLNLVLKTPTRILLRVASFKCSDFPKLYNKVKSINWSEYLKPETELSAQATARLSRLNMKNRIEKTCLDGYRHFKKDKGYEKSKNKVGLYIRLHKDICTLSLDTSGERLHKRGQRTHIGDAPLRETIAASLLLNLQYLSEETGSVEVVDPMMGTGAFLVEAQGLNEASENRDFNFEYFQSDAINNPVLKVSRADISNSVGYEIDAKSCEAAETNGVQNILNEDFFKASPLDDSKRWLVCNPPYGERLKVDMPLKEYYEKLFAKCEEVAKPDYASFILPTKSLKGKFNLPGSWKVADKRPFLNGGIAVTAMTFKR